MHGNAAGLEQLLSMADYVVTSTHFPASWTGEQCLGDALLTTLRCGGFSSRGNTLCGGLGRR